MVARSLTSLCLMVAGACVLTAAWIRANPQTGGQSARPSVFTEEQGKRGQALYGEYCAPCHGADLGGTQVAPLLSGADFITGWNDRSVGELFDRLRLTMPEDNPGRLTRQEYADITAFMLKSNGARAGAKTLDPDDEAQQRIRISETR
jgi:S-disulfanyl-L-cysteine oxidoreductase SoxD